MRALGEIKNSCVQRVAASATKSMLSGGSCKLFAAPGNQHLSLQSPPRPPQPLPPLPEATAAFLQPTYVMSTINEYRISAEKKKGEHALIFGAALLPCSIHVLILLSKLSLRVLQHQIPPGEARIPHTTRQRWDFWQEQGSASHQDGTSSRDSFTQWEKG